MSNIYNIITVLLLRGIFYICQDEIKNIFFK
jgi:hypothetical protein